MQYILCMLYSIRNNNKTCHPYGCPNEAERTKIINLFFNYTNEHNLSIMLFSSKCCCTKIKIFVLFSFRSFVVSDNRCMKLFFKTNVFSYFSQLFNWCELNNIQQQRWTNNAECPWPCRSTSSGPLTNEKTKLKCIIRVLIRIFQIDPIELQVC